MMKVLKLFLVAVVVLMATSVYAWQAGDRILGQWNDGLWYPAKITGQSGANFNVSFDDGDSAVLSNAKIKSVGWKVGSKVQCNWKNGGVYYTGTISKMSGNSVSINYDDGDREKTTVGKCRSQQ